MAKKKAKGSARKDARRRGNLFQGDREASSIGGDEEMQAALLAKEVAGEIWTPKHRGDSISGSVNSIESRNTKFGWQMLFLLDTGANGVYTVFMNSHMEREFQSLSIVPGDEIGVMYKEEVPTQAGNMRLFAVVNKSHSADELPERLQKRYDYVARQRAVKQGRDPDDDSVPF